MESEHLLPSSDENNNDSVSVITDDTTLNSNIDDTKPYRRSQYHQKSSLTMNHGLYKLIGPTLTIKRSLKHGKSNGEVARKLTAKLDTIRQQLEKEVRQLEYKQNNLISQVENLYLYKQQLQLQYKQTNNKLYE